MPRYWRSMLLSTLLLAGGYAVPAFAGWYDLSSPTSERLYDVDLYSTTALASGIAGIQRSTDSGLTWSTAYALDNDDYLYAIDMASASVAVAVGDHGKVYYTADGGVTWNRATGPGTDVTFSDVRMATTSTGYAVGLKDDGTGAVYKTTNSGSTWSALTTGGSDIWSGVDATSGTKVWIVGSSGTIKMTSDGGTTWTAQTSGTTNSLLTIDMVNSTTGWAGGESGTLLKTTNGGSTWTAVSTSLSSSVDDLDFTSVTSGFAVTSAGQVGQTSNGSTWSVSTVSSSMLHGVAYESTGDVVVGASGVMYGYDATAPIGPTTLTVSEYTGSDTISHVAEWDAATDSDSGVYSYEVSVDGGTYSTCLSRITYSCSLMTSLMTQGTHTVAVRAVDEAGNTSTPVSTTVTVNEAAPTVGAPFPAEAVVDEEATISVEAGATDDEDVSGYTCELYIASDDLDDDIVTMTYSASSGYFEADYTFTAEGDYTLTATCEDAVGNSTEGDATTLSVVAAATVTADTTAPTVGTISRSTATEDVAVTLSATYSDNVGVTSCSLYVNGSAAGSMTLSSGTASKSYTFTSATTYTAYVRCADVAGNNTVGTSTTITVSAASTTEDTSTDETDTAVDEAEEGNLLKMACPGGEDVNDPCRAVYYYGADGKRHAFPNEKVFFTWYEDFDDVIIVTDDFMASITLGRNVTYRPGATMVKFITVNTVYAVGEDGELRGIDSEDTAISIFGSDWNQQIHDISDAFYRNYSFGEDIDSTSDYDPDEAYDSVDSIDDIL